MYYYGLSSSFHYGFDISCLLLLLPLGFKHLLLILMFELICYGAITVLPHTATITVLIHIVAV